MEHVNDGGWNAEGNAAVRLLSSAFGPLFLPGLIDLQVNGYQGVDFSDADLTEEDFTRACRELLAAGQQPSCLP